MQGINVSREELRQVVEASFRVQGEENARVSRRLCEETGTPYNPQDEIQKQVLSALLIDPFVDYLMATITEEEFWAQMTKIIREYAQAQMPKEVDEETDEEEKEELRQMMGKMMDAVMNNMRDSLQSFFPMGEGQKNNIQYYQHVFRIAEERGITPAEVVTDAELRKEVARSAATREEFQARIQKVLPFLDPNNLLDVILKPTFGALASQIEADGEDPDEVYKEFREEAMQDESFQQQMKTLKDATSRILEEETNRIYG